MAQQAQDEGFRSLNYAGREDRPIFLILVRNRADGGVGRGDGGVCRAGAKANEVAAAYWAQQWRRGWNRRFAS
jgi:hypothetical protein